MSDRRWTKVSSMWVGGSLSWLEQLCLSSFVAKGYEVRLYSYDKLDVPSGVKLVDAREILHQDEIFRNPPPSKSYAGFSNVFRYELLRKKPEEVWIDTDVLALEKSLPDVEYLMGYESTSFVNGAVLRVPPKSELLHCLREGASAVDKKTFTWGDLGPKLITKKIGQLGLSEKVFERKEFYEIRAVETWKFFSPAHAEEVSARTCQSSAAHIWNEALKISVSNPKLFSPAPESFLGNQLKRIGGQHLPNQIFPARDLQKWRIKSAVQEKKNRVAQFLIAN